MIDWVPSSEWDARRALNEDRSVMVTNHEETESIVT
jgi:hypothetical protein